MSHQPNIGELFLKFRAEHSLTQKELAEILEIDLQQVSLYERGISKGSKSHIVSRYLQKLSEYDITKGGSRVSESLIKTYNTPINKINDNEHYKAIPFFQLNVSAGNVHFLDNGLLKGTEPDGYMFIPRHIDADIAFPTYGHSMHPDISNGDVVAYKVLKDMSFFNYGMKYLVVTDEQRMVKYIKPHAKQGYILLESKNPEFGPIDLPVKSIRHLLQVRYIGKTEM